MYEQLFWTLEPELGLPSPIEITSYRLLQSETNWLMIIFLRLWPDWQARVSFFPCWARWSRAVAADGRETSLRCVWASDRVTGIRRSDPAQKMINLKKCPQVARWRFLRWRSKKYCLPWSLWVTSTSHASWQACIRSGTSLSSSSKNHT